MYFIEELAILAKFEDIYLFKTNKFKLYFQNSYRFFNY